MTFESVLADHPDFEAALADLMYDWAHTPPGEKPFPWAWEEVWPTWAFDAYDRFTRRVDPGNKGHGTIWGLIKTPGNTAAQDYNPVLQAMREAMGV